MNKAHVKEIARDLRALGGIPFYFIVAVRAVIGQYALFVWQLIIAAAGLLFIYFTTRNTKMKSDMHIASLLVLCVFTSIFYNELYFTVFAFALGGLVIVASYYNQIKNWVIIRGLIAGIICSGLAYYISLSI